MCVSQPGDCFTLINGAPGQRNTAPQGIDVNFGALTKAAVVAFQAWGSGGDKQNVSLGLFYQDDTHNRWVLHFNDTKTLARLNMVFVTAEPRGGSAKPTGKPVLLAYLQEQPNHP